jgi:deoxyribose-phosphate aldolase
MSTAAALPPEAAPARLALACLDLTSLNDADDEAAIERLCERAVGPPGRGAVAAVCVWPRFAARARARLPAGIGVAAVANFPHGGTGLAAAVAEAEAIATAGGGEVDLVLPWRALAAGEIGAARDLLAAVRRAVPRLVLKVILESGELGSEPLIAEAARLALGEGADFLKTSTGKARVHPTPEAARTMLAVIAADAAARGRVGFKAAGGVREVADAALYAGLVRDALGEEALAPARFRIGASGLLDAIEAALGGTVAAASSGAPGRGGPPPAVY